MTSIDIPIVYNNLKAEIASLHTMLAGKEQEIVSLRARVAELEGKLAEAYKDDHPMLATAEAQRDKALAELAAEQAKGNWQGQHELEMTRLRERNLIAERDALKARKVKLPLRYNDNAGRSITQSDSGRWMLAQDVIEVIRAAGVEVE